MEYQEIRKYEKRLNEFFIREAANVEKLSTVKVASTGTYINGSVGGWIGAVVGGVAGFFLGGFSGAVMGASLGASIGNSFSKKKKKKEKARLPTYTFSVQGSSNLAKQGEAIPIVYCNSIINPQGGLLYSGKLISSKVVNHGDAGYIYFHSVLSWGKLGGLDYDRLLVNNQPLSFFYTGDFEFQLLQGNPSTYDNTPQLQFNIGGGDYFGHCISPSSFNTIGVNLVSLAKSSTNEVKVIPPLKLDTGGASLIGDIFSSQSATDTTPLMPYTDSLNSSPRAIVSTEPIGSSGGVLAFTLTTNGKEMDAGFSTTKNSDDFVAGIQIRNDDGQNVILTQGTSSGNQPIKQKFGLGWVWNSDRPVVTTIGKGYQYVPLGGDNNLGDVINAAPKVVLDPPLFDHEGEEIIYYGVVQPDGEVSEVASLSITPSSTFVKDTIINPVGYGYNNPQTFAQLNYTVVGGAITSATLTNKGKGYISNNLTRIYTVQYQEGQEEVVLGYQEPTLEVIEYNRQIIGFRVISQGNNLNENLVANFSIEPAIDVTQPTCELVFSNDPPGQQKLISVNVIAGGLVPRPSPFHFVRQAGKMTPDGSNWETFCRLRVHFGVTAPFEIDAVSIVTGGSGYNPPPVPVSIDPPPDSDLPIGTRIRVELVNNPPKKLLCYVNDELYFSDNCNWGSWYPMLKFLSTPYSVKIDSLGTYELPRSGGSNTVTNTPSTNTMVITVYEDTQNSLENFALFSPSLTYQVNNQEFKILRKDPNTRKITCTPSIPISDENNIFAVWKFKYSTLKACTDVIMNFSGLFFSKPKPEVQNTAKKV